MKKRRTAAFACLLMTAASITAAALPAAGTA